MEADLDDRHHPAIRMLGVILLVKDCSDPPDPESG
jgi:hypothetical protein